MNSGLKHKIFLALGLLIPVFIFGLFFIAEPSFGQTATDTFGVAPIEDNIGLGGSDIRVIIVRIINAVLGLLGIIALAIMIYGGYVWMTAGGNEERVATAKKILTNGTIGLVVILSAFSITTFILRRLGDATGIRTPGAYSDPCDVTPQPENCNIRFFEQCTEQHFVIKSMTPHTLSGEQTGMHNVVGRVLFSRQLTSAGANAVDLNSIVKIYKGAIEATRIDVSSQFSFALIEDGPDRGFIVEARPNGNCVGSVSQIGCVEPGRYWIEVLPEAIRDANGNPLEVETECGTYNTKIDFTTGDALTESLIDTGGVVIRDLQVNNQGNGARIPGQSWHFLQGILDDDHGNAYIKMELFKVSNGNELKKLKLDGPTIEGGSTADFSFGTWYQFPEPSGIPDEYMLRATGHDIDNNLVTEELHFTVVGSYCFDPQVDPNDPLCGGGAGDVCRTDSNCAAWMKCLDAADNTYCDEADQRCVCTPWPYIMDIEPLDGAPGNWVTIFGRNFGSDAGTVSFDYSSLQKQNALLAQCRVSDVWNDSWIIAEVPEEIISRNQEQAVEFNGSDAYAVAPYNIFDWGFEDGFFSVEFWVKPPADGIIPHTLLVGTAQADTFGVYTDATNLGIIQARVKDLDGEYNIISGDQSELVPGEWNHIVMTNQVIDGGTELKLYINHDLVNGEVFVSSGAGFEVSQVNEFVIGLLDENKFMRGAIDEVAVYAGVLTEEQIVSHFNVRNSGTAETYRNLIISQRPAVYWNFSNLENDSNQMTDISGNNRHGLFHGGVQNTDGPFSSEEKIKPSISVTTADTAFADSSADTFGPMVGYFDYNDKTRPGLCRVEVPFDVVFRLDDGSVVTTSAFSTVAPPTTPVHAIGKGFGSLEGNLLFGDTESQVSEWGDTIVTSSVPFLDTGDVAATIATSGGIQSNPVPFRIGDLAEFLRPVITSISPSSTTKGSYITILGNNFGTSGDIYFNLNNGNDCPGGGCYLAGEMPLYCSGTWTNTKIITKVPSESSFAVDTSYHVVVVRNDDNEKRIKSSGNEMVNVISGKPNPSICEISPSRGPAPLPGGQYLTIKGENFGSNPFVYFWAKDPVDDSLVIWLSERSESIGGLVHTVEVGKVLESPIPFDTHRGYSMSTGPIKVQSDGQFSNAVNYEVIDCREPGAPQAVGNFMCCTEGTDAGRWKEVSIGCDGQGRVAGYVSRFTTGKITKQFFVLERCNDSDAPSPSPWVNWPQGQTTCRNAEIRLTFNQPVDESSIGVNEASVNESNVKIYVCGNEQSPDCESDGDVTSQFYPSFRSSGDGEATVVFGKTLGELTANTWYRIGFTSDVTSLIYKQEFGERIPERENLKQTRPCEIDGTDFAYCFDFKTGGEGEICTMRDAYMEPDEHTTNLLGIVQNPSYVYIYDIVRIFNPLDPSLRPLHYFVTGKANQECTTINVDTKPWTWGPDPVQPTYGYATAHKSASSKYLNSRGIAKAWQDWPYESELFASTVENFNAQSQVISATSSLIIDLSSPKVVSRWPSCIEACINAEIGAQFDQIMATSTFTDENIELYKCNSVVDNETRTVHSDAECLEEGLGDEIPMYIPEQDRSDVLRFYANENMDVSSWYLVRLRGVGTDGNGGIRAIAGISETGDIRIGNAIDVTEWKFKTKDSPEPCRVDEVKISPDPFIAFSIGQKQQYKALPQGAPDQCSPYGQQLNPWTFGWDWSVENSYIATVSDFSFSGSVKPQCTIGCLPAGSDVSLDAYYDEYPICGNGIVDVGEDCDIAGKTPRDENEVPGVSCNFNCLRPGNNDLGNQNNQCGNNYVDYVIGEECDPSLDAYCTDTCVWEGSNIEATGSRTAPVCGDGAVTPGEDCDTDITITDASAAGSINFSKERCSQRCEHIGVQLSQEWCDRFALHQYDSRFTGQNTSLLYPQINSVCKFATSICGNGVVELGEECERNISNDSYCTNICLIHNVCGTAFEQCDPESEEGCAPDCTWAGASISYSEPSLCGDGQTGIGEFSGDNVPTYSAEGSVGADAIRCENIGPVVTNSLGQNPVQVVTALGEFDPAAIDITTSSLITQVLSTASKYRAEDGSATSLENPVTGLGRYALQCGYTELGIVGEQIASEETAGVSLIANDDVFVFEKNETGEYVIDVLTNDFGDGIQLTNYSIPNVPGANTEFFTEDGKIKLKVTLPDFSGINTLEYEIESEVLGTSDAGNVVIYIWESDTSTLSPTILNFEESGRLAIPFSDIEVDFRNYTIVSSNYLGSTEQNMFNTFGSDGTDGDESIFYLTLNPNTYGVVWFEIRQRFQDDEPYTKIVFVKIERGSQPISFFSESTQAQYNDCPANQNNEDNLYGVAKNSCCYVRPERVNQYPQVNEENVCRNTYIAVSFDREMDVASFGKSIRESGGKREVVDNVVIVEGYDRDLSQYNNYDCSEHGTFDVTRLMAAYLGDQTGDSSGFWQSVWFKIKSLFAQLFGGEAVAVDPNHDLNNRDIVWCTSNIAVSPEVRYERDTDDVIISTTAGLFLNNALPPNAYIAVVLQGGLNGVRDSSGVGIRSPFEPYGRNDFWVFKTGNDICKIDHIDVAPESQIYTQPAEQHDFEATAISTTGGQHIVPIERVYNWEWAWLPNNPVFEIPATTASYNTITASGVEGRITGVVQAEVVKDVDVTNNQTGKVFSDLFELHALFCSNPWPNTTMSPGVLEDVTLELGTYRDNFFNFSMYYCADDGNPLSRSDDMPYFSTPTDIQSVFSDEGLGALSDVPLPEFSSSSLKRILFFNDKNSDAIGLQVFKNAPDEAGNRRTIAQWFRGQFNKEPELMQQTTVAGYDALTDGQNFYINALNFDTSSDRVFNNVYVFSVDEDASGETRKVFEQIINSLEFNTNITDIGKCLAEEPTGVEYRARTHPAMISADADIDCSTDFDCRDDQGQPIVGTNGYCANQKTKFFRDLQRLSDLDTVQSQLDAYFATNQNAADFVGKFQSGSYVPGYTNSHWPSWGMLGSVIRSLPVDIINEWAGCPNHDPLTCWNAVSSTYYCPQFSQVYEYSFDSTLNGYKLFAPFEFFYPTDSLVSEYINTNKIDIENRWCEPETLHSPYENVCGDGIVNTATEQCDPPGRSRVSHEQIGYTVVEYGRCSYQGNTFNTECARDVDCGMRVVRSSGPTISTYTSRICVSKDEKVIYNNRNSSATQLSAIGCSTNSDCLDEQNYASQLPDGMNGLIKVEDIDREFSLEDARLDNTELFGENVAPYCLALSDIDDVTSVNPLQCIGAVLNQTIQNCPTGQYAISTCSASCQWTAGICSAGSTICGNGIVEGDEACDDGAQNGSYGHCNRSCNGRYIAYCGSYATFASEDEHGYDARIYNLANKDRSVENGGMLDYDGDRRMEFCEFTKQELPGDRKVALELGGYYLNAKCAGFSSNFEDLYSDLLSAKNTLDMEIRTVVDDLISPLQENIDSVTDADITLEICKLDSADCDKDGVPRVSDNCPQHKNPSQINTDRPADNFGDACDPCPGDGDNDSDKDGICNTILGTDQESGDNCPNAYNKSQNDTDGDGVGDVCEPDNEILDFFSPLFDGFVSDLNSERLDICQNYIGYCEDAPDTICRDNTDCKVSVTPYDLSSMSDSLVDLVNGFETDFIDKGPCIPSIKPYSKVKEYSCSWDCQSYGMYCGDGIIQRSYGEQCDDQNANNDDTCRNDCTIQQASRPVCGNSFVESGEQCDDGGRCESDINTQCKQDADCTIVGGGRCTPRGGDGCTSSCTIETSEAVCGDGTVDIGEDCDLGDENNTACNPEYGKSCSYCSRDCRRITVDPLAYCGNGKIDYSDKNGNGVQDLGEWVEVCDYELGGQGIQSVVFTTSSLSGDNYQRTWTCSDEIPLQDISKNVTRGRLSCANNCQIIDSSSCVECGFATNGAEPKARVLNVATGLSGNGADDWYAHNYLRFFFERTGNDWVGPIAGYLGNPNRIAVFTTGKISTNLMCNTYNSNNLLFNNYYTVGFNSDSGVRGDMFDYPVNNERSEVLNEYVISPPVPRNMLRVVVRWTDQEATSGYRLLGNIYKQGSGFHTNLAQIYPRMCSDSDLGNCIPYPTEDFYFHNIGNLEKNYTQAISIDTSVVAAGQSYAFYVSALLNSTGAMPMAQMTDKNITVELYEYHEGQNNQQSIYKPTKIYSIRSGVKNTSTNNFARYWHVFNIKVNADGSYRVTPVPKLDSSSEVIGDYPSGNLATDSAEVVNHTPLNG